MPLLSSFYKEFEQNSPLRSEDIALDSSGSKDIYLCRVLAAGGAQIVGNRSNVLSTQDDVAAALVADGLSVYAYHGATQEEYDRHIEMTLEQKPNIIIDDGGDLVGMIHGKRPDLGEEVWGGCEETTTGVSRLRAMER